MQASGTAGTGKIWKKMRKTVKESLQNPTPVVLNLHILNGDVHVWHTCALKNADFVLHRNTAVNLYRTL